MTTKNQELHYACENLAMALLHIREVKKMDVASRRKAKPSAKSKWTKAINKESFLISILVNSKKYTKKIPRRVA